MKQHNVFPECNVDTNLVGHILGGYAKHKSCCNEVVKAVNGTDEFAVGIIDADKRLATMDAGFSKYEQPEGCEGRNVHLDMYIHQDEKRYVFTVKPAMDRFIMDAATELNVNLREVGFSNTLAGFKKETKRVQAANDPKLRRLFQRIADSQELTRFRNTLKYLMAKQYDAKPSVAMQFFDGELTTANLAEILR